MYPVFKKSSVYVLLIVDYCDGGDDTNNDEEGSGYAYAERQGKIV